MRFFSKYFICLIIICLLRFENGIGQDISQEVIAVSGDNYQNSDASLNWTIGEIATETINNADNTLTQGFQQGYISVTSISEVPGSNISITVFPNPASSFVIIKLSNEIPEGLQFALYTLDGQELLKRDIKTSEEVIDLQNLDPSVYLLKVFNALNVFNVSEIVKQ
jgi:hypothetical protein